MLLSFIVLYLLASIGVGLYAATRVHNTADYAVAGRSLPLAVVIATTFATWFGSETVLGVSARFIDEFHLRAGQIQRGGNDIHAFLMRVGYQFALASERLIYCVFLAGDAQRNGQVGLWIQVNQEYPLAQLHHCSAYVDGARRFTNAAFVIQ